MHGPYTPPEPNPRAIDSQERFDEAIRAVRKRVPVPRDEWDAMEALERENAFTVARVTQMRVLQDVLDAVDSAVEHGTDLEAFKEQVAADLIESWGGEIPGRIENIFRTNIMTSYAEGRHALYSSPTVKEARPYLRFDQVDDDRECEECEKFNGLIRPQEDWKEATPPLHYQCRCQLVPLSREEAEEEGIADELPEVELDEGFGEAPSKRGDDWDFDLSGLDPVLRKVMEEA